MRFEKTWAIRSRSARTFGSASSAVASSVMLFAAANWQCASRASRSRTSGSAGPAWIQSRPASARATSRRSWIRRYIRSVGPLDGSQGVALECALLVIAEPAIGPVVIEQHAEGELDGVQRVLEVMGDHGHELVARPRCALGGLVEQGVIDRKCGAPPHVGGQLEIAAAVTPSGLRRHREEDRAERAPAGDHGDGDGRGGRERARGVQPASVPPVEDLDAGVGDELRPSRLQRLPDRVLGRGRRQESAKALEKGSFGRVAMRRVRPPRRAVLVEEDDDAVVRDLRDGQPDRVREGLLVLDRRVQGRARIGQEAPPPARASGPPG